ESRAVILATGANPRPIGCPGERELTGKGVSYCATCDGAFFEDMDIYVVGGGDSAVEEALYLTRFGRRVVLIHRRDALRAAKSIQEKAFANPKIEFMWDSVVTRLSGEGILSEMTVKNVKTGVESVIRANEDDGTFGVFVFVGLVPNSTLFGAEIPQQNGYILTDAEMQTGIPGVYAAGDIRVKSLRQVATAVSDGAIAAVQAERYLEGL
ncbi:MAG: FAD-dependent oxidoreductase, partial [Ruthenibacterium sp.]